MSYTILYRSMFAKVDDDKYIPMVEMGDNNCYELDNRKRVRSWQNWEVPGFGNKLALTREEIMQGVQSVIDEYKERYANQPVNKWEKCPEEYWTCKSIEQNFGWLSAIAIYGKHTTQTTARMFTNFFKRGFDKAIDLRAISQLFGKVPLNVMRWRELDNGDRLYTEHKSYDTYEEFAADLANQCDKKCWLEYDYQAECLWELANNLTYKTRLCPKKC